MVVDDFCQTFSEIVDKEVHFEEAKELHKFLLNDFEGMLQGKEIDLNYEGANGNFYGYVPKIQKYSLLNGPIYFGKDVFIGPFNFIRGPCFLGDGVFIGCGSEISRCILMDGMKSFHKNILLDSVIGKNVKFTALSSTANRKARSVIKDNESFHDTSASFGSVIESNCYFSPGCLIRPGSYVKEKTKKIRPYSVI